MAKTKSLRIIIDTNLQISFIISKNYRPLDFLLYSGNARFLFSTALINEIDQTIKKPKLKKYFHSNAMNEMLLVFEPYVNLVTVNSVVDICRDSNDNFLLELAKDSKADYLLTGDKDLLELKKFGKTRIITIKDFLSEMKIQLI